MTEETRDPVCGMVVDRHTAPSAEYDAQSYYFCSEDCRQKFVKDPARHVGNTGS